MSWIVKLGKGRWLTCRKKNIEPYDVLYTTFDIDKAKIYATEKKARTGLANAIKHNPELASPEFRPFIWRKQTTTIEVVSVGEYPNIDKGERVAMSEMRAYEMGYVIEANDFDQEYIGHFVMKGGNDFPWHGEIFDLSPPAPGNIWSCSPGNSNLVLLCPPGFEVTLRVVQV